MTPTQTESKTSTKSKPKTKTKAPSKTKKKAPGKTAAKASSKAAKTTAEATPKKTTKRAATSDAVSGKSLVVVESPAKARTIKKYLGKDFEVLASMGHIRDLPKSKLGVDLEKNFEPEYHPVKGKEKTLAALKKAAKGASRILLAPDPDREGEAIAWHVAEELHVPESRLFRVTFNEVTKEAVLRAINEPGRLNIALVEAQQARRILDRLVGYQISPLLWDKVRRGLSAGRVQSVAVRMVVEREQEILKFKAQEYWTIDVVGEGQKPPPFGMKLVQIGDEAILLRPEPEKRTKSAPKGRLITTEAEAKKIVEGIAKGPLTVASLQQKQAKRNPSPPFITSTLQQEASRKLRFSPKKAMMIAQRLYEGVDVGGEEGNVGLITYMRTDSVRISETALEATRAHIEKRYGKEYVPEEPNVYKTKKGAQDAHEAIRPTFMHLSPDKVEEKLTPDQFRLYTLIWNRHIACQMVPARLLQTRVELEDGKGHRFAATGSVIEFPGFLSVYQESQDDESEAEEGGLPPMAEGDKIKIQSIDPVQHFTQPPPRFTSASLVRELEARGIGRPSTYAAIVSTIITKDYVSQDQGRFKPTELGVMITDLLVENFPEVLDIKFTALMEEQLDEVEEGRVNWVELLRNFYDGFRRRMAEAKVHMRNLKRETIATDITCEKCGRPMVVKWGRNGRFLACSGYPECRNTMECEGEGGGAKRQEAPGQVCAKCGQQLIVKTGRNGRFAACPGYPECKHSEPLHTGVMCPREGCPGQIVERQSKKGRVFFACNQFPNCDQTIWERPIPEACPECKNPYMVEGKGNLRGRLKCPSCGHKKPLDLQMAEAG